MAWNYRKIKEKIKQNQTSGFEIQKETSFVLRLCFFVFCLLLCFFFLVPPHLHHLPSEFGGHLFCYYYQFVLVSVHLSAV